MKDRFRILLLLLAFTCKGYGQGVCPENIGFELGNFQHWQCYAGNIAANTGVITTSPTGPLPSRHTMIQNTFPQELDKYGGFPVNCPNGSGYSIRLGNDQVNSQVDGVKYTFVIPADKNEYSIIYNYAIVFQDPGHATIEQPKFTSKVYDETAGEYLSCGAFEYVATVGLPGFQQAPGSPAGGAIWYKAWSPVSIKLVGCAGKRITIEFTVNDCSRGGHFGYAYLDVNENCAAPISGNIYCNGANSITLTAPFGFQQYRWYTADFSALLGTGSTLKFSPIPPIGTRYALEVVPYPGLGCLDTLYTTIELSPEAFHFNLIDTFGGCLNTPADLTQPFVTQGSTPGLKLSYFTDSAGINYVPTAGHVSMPGTYYIKAVNNVGCTETKPMELIFRDFRIAATSAPDICYPFVADLTNPALITGADGGTIFTYWKDQGTTDPLPNPNAVSSSGRYYIKGQSGTCTSIAPVDVTAWDEKDVVTNDVAECLQTDLTSVNVTTGSASIFTYTQWLDTLATVPVPDPQHVKISGKYYIKASNTTMGCSFVKPVNITVKPAPDFTVSTPAPVTLPVKMDIRKTFASLVPYTYSFWQDTFTTHPLLNPYSIAKSGTYFIRAVDPATGCESVKPVSITVIVPFHPVITYPNAFSPNNDGVNDGFRIQVSGNVTYKAFKIFNRWGQVVFETKDPEEFWYGARNGKVAPAGTYYWIMELVNNNNNEFYRKTGAVTLLR